MNLTATDVKVFVPAKDFRESLRFYTALGWQLSYRADNDDIAELELASYRFYLQNYYNKAWANNFVLHVKVEDAHAWYQHVSMTIKDGNFKNARLNAPKEESYGALVTAVWDPSGVLLLFAQFHND